VLPTLDELHAALDKELQNGFGTPNTLSVTLEKLARVRKPRQPGTKRQAQELAANALQSWADIIEESHTQGQAHQPEREDGT
jgi:hypothetical protein